MDNEPSINTAAAADGSAAPWAPAPTAGPQTDIPAAAAAAAVTPVPVPTPTPTPNVNADVLAIRFAARLVDGIVALPFALLFLIPILGPMLFAVGLTTYFVYCESAFGGTIGKRVFNLQVRKVDGTPIDARGAFLRNGFLLFGLVPYIGAIFSLLTLFVIGLAIAFSSDRRGPHDKLGNACVVRPLPA